MPLVTWQPGITIDPPVYLDANILVGFIIRGQPLYQRIAQFISELLAFGSTIYVSLLGVEESLWAISRISYYELAHHRPGVSFTPAIYRRWRQRMFDSFGPRFSAIGNMLQEWGEAGVPIEVVPKQESLLWQTLNLMPQHMQQHGLSPADATHLALAQTHARTLATADRTLAMVTNDSGLDSLVSLYIAGSGS